MIIIIFVWSLLSCLAQTGPMTWMIELSQYWFDVYFNGKQDSWAADSFILCFTSKTAESLKYINNKSTSALSYLSFALMFSDKLKTGSTLKKTLCSQRHGWERHSAVFSCAVLIKKAVRSQIHTKKGPGRASTYLTTDQHCTHFKQTHTSWCICLHYWRWHTEITEIKRANRPEVPSNSPAENKQHDALCWK